LSDVGRGESASFENWEVAPRGMKLLQKMPWRMLTSVHQPQPQRLRFTDSSKDKDDEDEDEEKKVEVKEREGGSRDDSR
jgi:hypothetical protein